MGKQQMNEEQTLEILSKHVASGGRIILGFRVPCMPGELIDIVVLGVVQAGRVVREATYDEFLAAFPTGLPRAPDQHPYYYEVESD